MRARSVILRTAIMAVIGGLLWSFAHWTLAPVWWLAYAGLQWMQVRLSDGEEEVSRGVYVVSFLSYVVAGSPAWHLWTHVGDLGIAAATMFLCGMLVQLVVSSLGAGRLFWASATPLVGYLVFVPPFAFGADRLAEGLAVVSCAVLLVFYMTVLWVGQQKALDEIRHSRLQAVQARRDAEAASQAKTDFLATMSHELRTPMNAVLGAADLLGRTPLDEEQRGHLAMLADGGAILMHVLNDVLDLAKIEAGKLSIDPVRTDIHDFVRRCAALWAPRADDKRIGFSVSIGPDVPQYVMADATRLGQIAFNLLSNALKFTEAGSIALSLGTEAAGPGRAGLVLRVADTGIGMSADSQARLFSAFNQADASISRRFGGTGLGLSISQKLAEMMDGRISVTSEPGRGSTFTLRLGVEVARAPEADVRPGEEPDAQSGMALRILVAEDNLSNQRIIDFFLRPLGAEVTIVGDGQQALEALSVSAFDLVLMDMQMPVMDGLEATRRLRASGGVNAGVPVLALTANVMDAQKKACFEAGMNGHIAKPIDARVLLTSVISACDPGAGGDEAAMSARGGAAA